MLNRFIIASEYKTRLSLNKFKIIDKYQTNEKGPESNSRNQ